MLQSMFEKQTSALKVSLHSEISEVTRRLDSMGARLDAQDSRLDAAESRLTGHDQEIDNLKKQMASLSAASKRASSADAPRQSVTLDREAWMGGFPRMVRDKLEKRATDLIGQPDGFQSLRAPQNPGSGVIMLFDTAEKMR
eukprot:3823152-Karenia_brevis.AAC.1